MFVKSALGILLLLRTSPRKQGSALVIKLLPNVAGEEDDARRLLDLLQDAL